MPAMSLMGRATLLAIFRSFLATFHILWESICPGTLVLSSDLGAAFAVDLFTAAKWGGILIPSSSSAQLFEASLE